MSDRNPFPTGVISGDLSPIPFLLTESMAARGMPIVPSGCFTGDTSTGSQSMGASAAAKILQSQKKALLKLGIAVWQPYLLEAGFFSAVLAEF